MLQISDTHFGTERAEVVEALARLAEELRPQLVVLSGDITQRARPKQFAAAAAFARRLGPAALLAIPGNHDVPLFDLFARLLQPYARYARAFGPELEPAFESDDFLVLGVNTTRATRHKQGEISAGQVARVCGRLARAASRQLRVVVTHHPLHVRHGEEHNLCRGHADALRAWARAGADVVMGGHIHLPYVERVPDLPRALWAVQAGTAVSRRVRPGGGEANSVNALRYEAGEPACSVERYDYGTGAFSARGTVRIRLDR